MINTEAVVEESKVESVAVGEIVNGENKAVEIIAAKPGNITDTVLAALKDNAGKTLTMGAVDKDNNLMYSWTFAGSLIADAPESVDISVDFGAPEKKADIEKLINADAVKPMYINFTHHGELPGAATVGVYAGRNFPRRYTSN